MFMFDKIAHALLSPQLRVALFFFLVCPFFRLDGTAIKRFCPNPIPPIYSWGNILVR